METAKLVLEKCGTEVDDDEVLAEVTGEALLLLVDGETYAPLALPDINPSVAGTSAAGNTAQPSNSSSETVMAGSSGAESYASHRSSYSLSLPLPELSKATKDDLLQGDKSRRVWLQLIEESKNYYMKYCPQIDENPYGAYKIIGQKMLAAYPSIERDGKHKWSQYARALSQSMRSERFRRKKKSLQATPQPPPKMFAISKHAVTDASSVISEEECERHVVELQKEWRSSSCNSSHLNMLLKETYVNRRQWLPTLPTGKLAPILEKFPCFEEGNYVVQEVQHMMLADLSAWRDRLQKIIEVMRDKVPTPTSNSKDEHDVDVMKFIEKSVAFKKGKGVKSKTCLTVADSNISDAEKNQLCSSAELSPPCIVIFVDEGKCKDAYIVGDNCKISCKSVEIVQIFITLLACYYCFDLSYPRIYSQLLGFLQQFVMHDPYSLEKSSDHKHFIAQYQDLFG